MSACQPQDPLTLLLASTPRGEGLRMDELLREEKGKHSRWMRRWRRREERDDRGNL